MTTYDFFNRLNQICKQHNYKPAYIWSLIPLDEWDWVSDTDQGWLAIEAMLTHGFDLPVANHAPYPVIECKSCKHYSDDSGRYCAFHKKQIPRSFNINDGCKRWNE